MAPLIQDFRTYFRYIKLFCYFSSIYGILFHSLARYSVRSDAILKIKSKIVKYLHFSYLFEWEIYNAVLKKQNLFVRYWSFLDKSLLKIFCLFQHAHNVFRKKNYLKIGRFKPKNKMKYGGKINCTIKYYLLFKKNNF